MTCWRLAMRAIRHAGHWATAADIGFRRYRSRLAEWPIHGYRKVDVDYHCAARLGIIMAVTGGIVLTTP
ncbi:hypothetical protein [Candidatus Sodalis sp. SoCistrobi]|uniref:hypothetical protein n=1 Tax=Candidatus Sodalis sp. SoCistrobi TaxID=1922216 RepID=UPI000F7ADD0A|nr:hypothetical protein [Candidatus Sodalis sp. SoCistrobi]